MRFIIAVLLVLFGAAMGVAAQSGLILRGTLTAASSDGTHYFNVGEAMVIMLPHKDSALAPGLQSLVGHRVVITILKDEGGIQFGKR